MSENHMGNPMSLLKPEGVWVEPIEISKGGKPHEQGTWGHPEVALKLAAWIKPRLEVWVVNGLKTALSQSQEQLEEVSNQLTLADYRNDQLRYERDELSSLANWRKENSFTGRDAG
jgi:hypothetical protein